MWRRWHLCSHLRSVLLVDTFESPEGETSSRAVIPEDTGAQGISCIPFNDKLQFKKRKDTHEAHNGDQFNRRWQRPLMYSRELEHFLFSMIVTAWKASLVHSGPHVSHSSRHAATLCSIISLIPELLHFPGRLAELQRTS